MCPALTLIIGSPEASVESCQQSHQKPTGTQVFAVSRFATEAGRWMAGRFVIVGTSAGTGIATEIEKNGALTHLLHGPVGFLRHGWLTPPLKVCH